MKTIKKIALYLYWTLIQLVIIFSIVITYPYQLLKHRIKPNLNKRPFKYTMNLQKNLSDWINKKIRKI
jgi:hypothetical protein